MDKNVEMFFCKECGQYFKNVSGEWKESIPNNDESEISSLYECNDHSNKGDDSY